MRTGPSFVRSDLRVDDNSIFVFCESVQHRKLFFLEADVARQELASFTLFFRIHPQHHVTVVIQVLSVIASRVHQVNVSTPYSVARNICL